ncbi:hypothetical protein LCGC14_1656630 [marine sediment metagenome]|uniref:Uncharacterized protein n=1 Tax=marine sediment metagenome TaxID=412755 RepID=A0A0F9HVA5_9ZZZZ
MGILLDVRKPFKAIKISRYKYQIVFFGTLDFGIWNFTQKG